MKVLISDESFGKANSNAIKMLQDAGLQPVNYPQGKTFSENDYISELSDDVIGIIAGVNEPFTKKVMEEAKSLKVISRFGTGIDNIDIEAAKEHGIVVCRTADAPTQAVAELTLALMLNLSRKINETDKKVRSGKWTPEISYLIYGKTIGIVGLGRIGKVVVKLLEPFNVKILVYEPYPDDKFILQYKIKLVPLNNLIAESDIISLHTPLTKETKGMIGKDELRKMKNHALLINTARGGLIDENALAKALENHEIGGAALDVFEKEPYDGKLTEFDNVILTPHIGTFTIETRKKMEIQTVENLIKALEEMKIIKN